MGSSRASSHASGGVFLHSAGEFNLLCPSSIALAQMREEAFHRQEVLERAVDSRAVQRGLRLQQVWTVDLREPDAPMSGALVRGRGWELGK